MQRTSVTLNTAWRKSMLKKGETGAYRLWFRKGCYPTPIGYAIFGLIGFMFLFFCLTGRDLAVKGNILWTTEYVLKMLGISLGVGGALGAAICYIFYKVALNAEEGTVERRTGCKKIFAVSSGLIFLAWIPGFLAYYPAICAYDMPIQLGQIIEGAYNDHHPIFHTLLIKWAITFGESVFGGTGAANAGIGTYALLQMALLASAFAFGISLLWQRGIKRIWLILIQLYCMLYPFHMYMSISVTKDTIFSFFFVLQVLALGELLDTHRSRDFVLFSFASVGMMLFRTNGKYAFLVFLIVLGFVLLFGKEQRRLWGRLLLWSLGAFLIGNLMLSAFFRATDARQGDRRELLSMPIQQLARTMVYHGGIGVRLEDDNTMEEADKALINDFILNEGYRKYRPDFADPVKSNTNTFVARYRTKEFLTTYFRLLVRYPGDFVNAALAVDAGYLYPGDVSHAYVNAQEGQAAGGGYAQTRWDVGTLEESGIFKESKWQWLHEVMEQWADDNAYLRLPLLKYLFVPGTWIWVYLLLAGWWLLRREFRLCIPLVLVFGYYLTLLLGPTVQLRYIYPIMIVFPFLLFSGKGHTGIGFRSE